MDRRNESCWCGSGKKWKKCHFPAISPKGAFSTQRTHYWNRYHILLKDPEQITGIKAASKLAANILKATCAMAKAGVTTAQLNDFAHKLHLEAGATPAPLGYGFPPFPKSICTSLNDVICHGIPNDVPLKEGDIINIDVTAKLNGYYGDCSAMVMIGEVSDEKKRVVKTSYDCLMESIAILKPGVLVSEIGTVIEKCAHKNRCSVVHQFVAHGVGVEFHEEPQIAHLSNRCHIPLAAGMTFTIEPMINAGVAEGTVDPTDHWTARTKDGRPSAQWEHTLLITDSGYEILTLPD